MSWLLDTDVICQPAKRRGDARVVAWLEQEKNECYTSAVVIAPLRFRRVGLEDSNDVRLAEELCPADRIAVVLAVADGRIGAGRKQQAHDLRVAHHAARCSGVTSASQCAQRPLFTFRQSLSDAASPS
jgi:predicted nucleic acid-binding protein